MSLAKNISKLALASALPMTCALFLTKLALSESLKLPELLGLNQDQAWNIGHILGFFTLCFLAYVSYRLVYGSPFSDLPAWIHMLWALILSFAIGVHIEIIQSKELISHEYSDADVLLDVIGGQIGVFIAHAARIAKSLLNQIGG